MIFYAISPPTRFGLTAEVVAELNFLGKTKSILALFLTIDGRIDCYSTVFAKEFWENQPFGCAASVAALHKAFLSIACAAYA